MVYRKDQQYTVHTYLKDEGGQGPVICNNEDALTVVQDGHPVNDAVDVQHVSALSETVLAHSNNNVQHVECGNSDGTLKTETETIMPELRPNYDERLILQNILRRAEGTYNNNNNNNNNHLTASFPGQPG